MGPIGYWLTNVKSVLELANSLLEPVFQLANRAKNQCVGLGLRGRHQHLSAAVTIQVNRLGIIPHF